MDRPCTYVDPHNQERCTECGVLYDLCQCVNLNDMAHQRLHSPDGVVLSMVRGELEAQRKTGEGMTRHLLASLGEEVGILNHRMISHDEAQTATVQEVLRAAVRVATVAVRIAAEGDDNFLYQFPTQEDELPRGPVGGRYD